MLETYKFFALIICCEIFLVHSQSITPNIFQNITLKSDKAAVLSKYEIFVRDQMDQSADPCEDFYQFSCGNFKNSVILLADSRGYVTSSRIMKNQYKDKFIRYFREPTTDENKNSEIKMKKFYSSCVESYDRPFEKGFKELINIVEEIISKDNKNKTDWIDINFSSSFNRKIFLSTYTYSGNKSVIGIYPWPILRYLDLKTFAKNINLEPGQEYDVIKEEIRKVNQIDELLSQSIQRRNSTEILPLNEFISAYKRANIDWERLFDFKIADKNNWIVENSVKDINKFAEVLQNTDRDILELCVKWNIILKFYEVWKLWDEDNLFCLSRTVRNFQNVLIPWVLKTLINDESRSELLEVSRSMKDYFGSVIDQLEWMDESTRSKAKTKLNDLNFIIGYKDTIKNHTVNETIYDDINISDNFWKNFINIEINSNKDLSEDIKFSPFGIEIDNNYKNEIFVATNKLQLPLYHRMFPTSLKFGGIGASIGNEISKLLAFFSVGNSFYFDEKRKWLSEQSLRNFEKHDQCLKDQFNQLFVSDNRSYASDITYTFISENIGLRLSYNAYLSQLKKASEADSMPFLNLDLTNKQLFFLQYGQTLCEWFDSRLLTDQDKYRLGFGAFMNMPEFSDAFQCKPGTKMNPLKKCTVW